MNTATSKIYIVNVKIKCETVQLLKASLYRKTKHLIWQLVKDCILTFILRNLFFKSVIMFQILNIIPNILLCGYGKVTNLWQATVCDRNEIVILNYTYTPRII